MIGALVLAGGAGRRFGADKRIAALPSGKSLLEATVSSLSASFEEILLVLRPGDEVLASALSQACTKLTCVFAPKATLGMGHSLAHGASLISDWEGAAICLGDMPFIQPSSFQQIQLAFFESELEAPIISPSYERRPGHPVLFHHRYFAALGALKGDQGARRLLLEHTESVIDLALSDAGILQDVDRPSDLNRP